MPPSSSRQATVEAILSKGPVNYRPPSKVGKVWLALLLVLIIAITVTVFFLGGWAAGGDEPLWLDQTTDPLRQENGQ